MDYSEYYTYLISLIDPPAGVESRLRKHGMLLFELWKREFYWFDSMEEEENRSRDGKNLRDQFIMDFDMPPDKVPQGPCNILEMLVALSLKLDAIVHDWRIGNRPWEWVEMFIENLGFDDLTDDNINPMRDSAYINAKLDTFLTRNLGPKGEGGLFRFHKPLVTVRQLDIWAQMNKWIIENFNGLNN